MLTVERRPGYIETQGNRVPDLAFDLRYFNYAVAAAEHGSFRRAVNALSISQSMVSRRVQLLERRIGIALFERTRSGVKLTVAGERFMREASVGASHLREAVNSIATARRGDFGELRIGLMASLASGFLADLLAAYHQRFPSVELKLREATSQTNAAGVLNGWLDVAFIPGEPKLPGCKSRKLGMNAFMWRCLKLMSLPHERRLPGTTFAMKRSSYPLMLRDRKKKTTSCVIFPARDSDQEFPPNTSEEKTC